MTEEQKETYSAFASEISEILGLEKPVDVLKLCVVTDRFFKPLQNQIKELQEKLENKESEFRKFKADYQELCLLKDMRIDDKDMQIEKLQKQIEKMKNCLNYQLFQESKCKRKIVDCQARKYWVCTE